MPGHVSIGKSVATGWAVHPRLPDYRVLVHVISGTRVLGSVVANQAPLGAGAASRSWFSIDLNPFGLSKPELRSLLFYAAETDEYLESNLPAKPASTGRITLESMLAAKRAKPWVSGATYVDAGACLTDWEIVDLFYRDFLGRPADASGLSEYVRQLQEGAQTLEDIRLGILSSQEYASRGKDAARPPGAIFSDPLVRLIADTRRQGGVVPRAEVANDSNMEPDIQAEESLPDVSEIESPADSPVFGAGWHAVELIGGKAFRWMGRSGQIQNPRPDLSIRDVTVHVAAVYGSRAPMIECYLDDARASSRVVRSGGGFVIEISPSRAHSGRFASLKINSQAAGSPIQDGVGRDDRVLSLNVLRVVSRYHTTHRATPVSRPPGVRRALRVLQSLTGLVK